MKICVNFDPKEIGGYIKNNFGNIPGIFFEKPRKIVEKSGNVGTLKITADVI